MCERSREMRRLRIVAPGSDPVGGEVLGECNRVRRPDGVQVPDVLRARDRGREPQIADVGEGRCVQLRSVSPFRVPRLEMGSLWERTSAWIASRRAV